MLNHLVFLGFFCFFFSKVRVGAKEGGSHYWEMAVAITCGYGGYLLPLLAAHSSFPQPTLMLNHLFFLFFFAFFFISFSKVRVGAKEGGSHYWRWLLPSLVDTGGYLLPLLAAHSSFC